VHEGQGIHSEVTGLVSSKEHQLWNLLMRHAFLLCVGGLTEDTPAQ
jgi:hypothetical protein